MKKYNVEKVLNNTVIWYEEDGYRYSFMADSGHPEYEEYLKSLDEASTL
jgi:hypothetical protein